MIEILLRINGREVLFQLESAASTIGRSQGDIEVRVPLGTVARHHARLTELDGLIFIEDLASTNGTHIDGVQIRAGQPTRLAVGQRVTIGFEASFNVVHHKPVIAHDFEAREAAFLEPLQANRNDDAIREVYSDWLEEHHELLRAEWLRTELALRRGISNGADCVLLSRAFSVVDNRLAAAKRWRMLVSRDRPARDNFET